MTHRGSEKSKVPLYATKKLNFFLLNIKHEQSLFEYWVEKQFSEGTSHK